MDTSKKLKKCQVCESTDTHQWSEDKNFSKCLKCQSVVMTDEVNSTYDKDYYDRGNKGYLMRLIDRFSFWDRYLTLGLEKNDRILEIGFGEGKFLRELNERRFRVWGVEKSEYAREKMKMALGEDKVYEDVDMIKEKFEVVVMYHVLEHIRDPKKYIKKILNILTPEGRLIVRVPNINSWEALLAGKEWYHLDYPNHQILFSEAGLVKMFEDSGYKDIKSRNYFGEYRQVFGYSILSKLGIKLNKWQMITFQLVTIPILWIFLVLMAQHGVVEVEGHMTAVVDK